MRRDADSVTSKKARIEEEIAEDLTVPEMWEPLAESSSRRGPLETQVSIRLEAEDAQKLRRVADAKGLGYTTLLRDWIRERLHAEVSLLASFTYETDGQTSAASVQVSSGQLQIRDLAVA